MPKTRLSLYDEEGRNEYLLDVHRNPGERCTRMKKGACASSVNSKSRRRVLKFLCKDVLKNVGPVASRLCTDVYGETRFESALHTECRNTSENASIELGRK